MTLETFFEKFDQFADAPDAVAKLRELVLDWAVRGKLVVQNVTEESASQLLKRVLAEKNRRTGSSEHSDEEAGSPQDDEAFEIPGNWEWIGATTPAIMVSDQGKKVQTKDILEAGKYPVVDQGKMFIRGYCDNFDKVISVAEPIVLFGDHTRETKFIDFDFVVGADGVKLLQPICIDPRFYFLVLRWLPLESRGYARHFKLLKAARIPLPPLAEQKRIVAKVDELMALCDRLEAQQKERATRHAALARASLARFADAPNPANLNFIFHKSFDIPPADLRKSILTLAVQGKLVPQDPNDEPAEVLLARLMSRDAQASGRRKKSQPDLAFTADEIPFELPPGWAWERLGNIGETNIGLTYSPQDVSDVGIPVLRSSNVQNGKLDFEDLVRVNCEPKQSAMVQDGDLLICARNGSRALVGKVAVIESLTEPAAFGAFMAIFRSEVNQYLYHFIRSPLFRQMIDEVNTTTINQITQGNLRSTLAPLPPLAEQRRIVAKVEQLMALVDALETQLAASRDKGQKLLEAVVGELTLAS